MHIAKHTRLYAVHLKFTHKLNEAVGVLASQASEYSFTTCLFLFHRFCLYPQDIVIQLDKRSRLKKVQVLSHQYLIASRVEFFVGDIPPDVPVNLQNARYTRLGYSTLMKRVTHLSPYTKINFNLHIMFGNDAI